MVYDKAILVPVDFTGASRHAVMNAIELAQKLNSAIYLVNFIPPFRRVQQKSRSTVENMSGELSSYINLVKENERKLCEMLREIDNSELSIHSEIKIDRLNAGIKKQLKRKDIGLIVTGIAGAHTIGDSFYKTDTAHEVIDVDCPVVICNNRNFKFNGAQSMVVSLDLITGGQQNIEKLASIAENLCFKVRYVHVNDPADEKKYTREDVMRYLKRHKLKADSIDMIDSSNREEAILNYAGKQKAHLIAINKFSRSSCNPAYPTGQVVREENLVFVY